MKKQHLPTKICVKCGLPFSWRKKWKKVWYEVKYCSDKCRREKFKKITRGNKSLIFSCYHDSNKDEAHYEN